MGIMGASPQIGEMLPLSDFLTVLSCLFLFFFLDPAPRIHGPELMKLMFAVLYVS